VPPARLPHATDWSLETSRDGATRNDDGAAGPEITQE
jgi:hypothetical protein